MCAVSYVAEQAGLSIETKYPWTSQINTPPVTITNIDSIYVELCRLRTEVEEIKKLLILAKRYDELTNQPNCEKDEKVGALIKIAKLVDVDLEDVLTFKKENV